MKAAFVSQKNKGGIELKDVEKPNLKEGDILVKMMASGICGTDLEKLSGGYTASTVLGHEVSGTITESKDARFNAGERVVPHHHVACGECYFCLHGSATMCQGFRNSNFDPGGFAEEFRVPAYNVKRGGVHKIGGISFEEASFAEPLACCIRALNKALPRITKLENALVVGAGPIGLLHMELLRSKIPELNLVTSDVSKTRLEFAERNENATVVDVTKSPNGLFSKDALKHTPDVGFDFVLVATGNQSAFAEAVRCVRKSGTLLLFGAPHKGATYFLDLQSMLLQELTLFSSYATTEAEIDEALRLLKEGKINVRKFITSTYPLEQTLEAMQAARSESQVKVLVASSWKS